MKREIDMLFSLLSRKMIQLINNNNNNNKRHLVSTSATSYERRDKFDKMIQMDTIRALNTLQTNAQYLKTASSNHQTGSTSIREMKKYLIRSGLTLEDVDKLSVIHVAGTKGKGSCCALTESILRNNGYRTGFYSSPHLIKVTERIRIDGEPIKENKFAKYFWQVYDTLNDLKENDNDMPTYFKFLTILMFHIFLNSDIDVVILEVGIGGEYDCTNVVRNPICVGITSLGLEHTALLGNNLESIARQKSGIFKKNTTAFTVVQPDEAMKILIERAADRNCKLRLVPDFKSYSWPNGSQLMIGIPGKVQEMNASLAVQLSNFWMFKKNKNNNFTSNDPDLYSDKKEKNCPTKIGKSLLSNDEEEKKIEIEIGDKNYHRDDLDRYDVDRIPKISLVKIAEGLSSCKWPGRMQILRGKTIDFYLDGAHTYESIELCCDWYDVETKTETKIGKRYLIFNVTGDRDVDKLLKPLKNLRFRKVYFVPNISVDNNNRNDNTSQLDRFDVKTSTFQRSERCKKNQQSWGAENNSMIFDNINDAFDDIIKDNISELNTEKNKNKNDYVCDINRPQVLVTGSLHLVGAALFILDPNLTMKTDY